MSATTLRNEEVRASQHPLARCLPRGDRVVVRRDVSRDRTEGGVLLPDSVRNAKMPTGTVISVGPGRYAEDGRRVPIGLQEGDRVILTGYAGLEIRDPGVTRSQEDEYVILREEDIVAVLND